MNKRGDIPIVILVLGIVALLIFGLMSFYLVGEKTKSGGINSVFHLQKVYNNAESVKFSDEILSYKYGVGEEEGKFVLSKIIMEEKSGFWDIGKKQEILKIKYTFDK